MASPPLRLQRWTFWLFALAVLLYLRPYTGIRHDAPLYLVQALYLLHPDIYAHDIFFVAGSQGDYTLFPRLIALLIAHFSPGEVFLWLTLLGRVLFYAASWILLRALLPNRWRMPALLALLAMPTRYGAYGIFSYAEPFLTSRPYAEALTLVAIGCTVRGRLLLAALALLVAGMLHPLQALAGAIFAWCWLVRSDRRWLWCLLALLPVCGLALLGIKPFGQLFQHIDNDWLELISTYSSHIFLSNWRPTDWCIALTDFYLLYSVAIRSDIDWAVGRMAKSAMLAMVLGLGITLLLADTLKLVLPTGLQLWRVLWCTHWTAIASLPWLLGRAWKNDGRMSALLLGATAVLGASLPGSEATLLATVTILLHIVWRYWGGSVRPSLRKVIAAAVMAIMVVSFLRYAMSSWMVFNMYGGVLSRVRQDVVLLSHPLLLGVVALCLWCVHKRAGRLGAAVLFCVGVLAVAGSVSAWDSRSPWTRTFERYADEADVFGASIPEKAQVYWYSAEKLPLGAWLTLNRASYFSIYQMSGQMFHRETSIMGIKRHLQIIPAEKAIQECEWKQTKAKPEACEVGKSELAHLCTPYGDLAPPDYFVMPIRQSRAVNGQWQVHDAASGKLQTTLYLYRCSDWEKRKRGDDAS
ncbi:hypothetical protein [Pseudoxanthomonas spadix]|uniref:hypothetical protein n=1 Tax=Pseudoxanthomonas spadix TaxID=415229 RepID=UPI0011C47C93|nr:hypothetical protein [Pseudoxanthomonas spadix]MBP3973605.1 hypothetical protein [Pseudoxanthomonas spadix]